METKITRHQVYQDALTITSGKMSVRALEYSGEIVYSVTDVLFLIFGDSGAARWLSTERRSHNRDYKTLYLRYPCENRKMRTNMVFADRAEINRMLDNAQGRASIKEEIRNRILGGTQSSPLILEKAMLEPLKIPDIITEDDSTQANLDSKSSVPEKIITIPNIEKIDSRQRPQINAKIDQILIELVELKHALYTAESHEKSPV